MANNEEKSLRDLLVMKLQALYDIETQIVKALPKMAEAASEPDLAEAFETHLAETEEHVSRLEQIFEILGEKPEKLEVDGIRGIIKDGEWVIKNITGDNALDANLITAARYVEHYEMAGYMGAKEWAELLSESEVADLLEETLSEERMADEKLAALSTTPSEALVV